MVTPKKRWTKPVVRSLGKLEDYSDVLALTGTSTKSGHLTVEAVEKRLPNDKGKRAD